MSKIDSSCTLFEQDMNIKDFKLCEVNAFKNVERGLMTIPHWKALEKSSTMDSSLASLEFSLLVQRSSGSLGEFLGWCHV